MKTTFRLIRPFHNDIENPTVQQIADVVSVLPEIDFKIIEDCADFLIVEKTGKTYEDLNLSYMQARPHRAPKYEGMFTVECRDDVPQRHYRGYIEADGVTAIFASFLSEDAKWRDAIIWRDISFQFDDLCSALPYEESTASFFDAEEWQISLEQKKRREEFWEYWDKLLSEPS